VAQFGQLHPQTAASRKLRQDVFLAEVSLDLLYRHELRDIRYRALPRYPAVARDFSFIFPDSVLFENIHEAVKHLDLEQLRTFSPVEVFRGGSVPAGKYSLLLRATYQSGERTMVYPDHQGARRLRRNSTGLTLNAAPDRTEMFCIPAVLLWS
jgi:phenylalanyl-tRNA synthetase beta chain